MISPLRNRVKNAKLSSLIKHQVYPSACLPMPGQTFDGVGNRKQAQSLYFVVEVQPRPGWVATKFDRQYCIDMRTASDQGTRSSFFLDFLTRYTSYQVPRVRLYSSASQCSASRKLGAWLRTSYYAGAACTVRIFRQRFVREPGATCPTHGQSTYRWFS